MTVMHQNELLSINGTVSPFWPQALFNVSFLDAYDTN
jgi:hypothetical protein